MRERRHRIVWVPQSVMMNMIAKSPKTPYEMVLLTNPSLPEGYKVVSVYHDFNRQSFGVLVYHESFEVVPDGQIAPEGGIVVAFQLKKPMYPKVEGTWPEEGFYWAENRNGDFRLYSVMPVDDTTAWYKQCRTIERYGAEYPDSKFVAVDPGREDTDILIRFDDYKAWYGPIPEPQEEQP